MPAMLSPMPIFTFDWSIPLALQKAPNVLSATSVSWPTTVRPSRSFGDPDRAVDIDSDRRGRAVEGDEDRDGRAFRHARGNLDQRIDVAVTEVEGAGAAAARPYTPALLRHFHLEPLAPEIAEVLRKQEPGLRSGIGRVEQQAHASARFPVRPRTAGERQIRPAMRPRSRAPVHARKSFTMPPSSRHPGPVTRRPPVTSYCRDAP